MIIYGKKISKEKINLIINEVQAKKEYSNFSEKYIIKYMQHLLKKKSKVLEFISSEQDIEEIKKKKIFQNLIKEIREKVRRIYGVYITKKYNKKEEYLAEKNIELLLKSHLSTKERFSDYKEIYGKIKELTEEPKTILDLGCGLNPLSQKYIGEYLEYNASDISEKDIKFLKQAYAKFGFKGNLFRADLSEEKELIKLNKYKTDWCLILKALDPIEESNQNISYKLVPAIKSRWIIVSFPTLTVSQKKMRNPRRNWFEKILIRTNKQFNTFETKNELFYIIKNF